MSMLDELDRELRAVQVPRAARRRLAAELADHLACDPSAAERLGAPATIARRYADEMGTVLTRRAAFVTFGALAPLGVLFVALFGLAAVSTTNIDAPLTVLLVLGTQLAFVGGTLGVLRAWRLRDVSVIPAAEAEILVRRAALGVFGGATTVATLAWLAATPGVQWSVPALTWTTVAVGTVATTAAAVALARVVRFRPVAVGTAGDLIFDIGRLAPPALRTSARRMALAIAAAVALAIAVDGAAAGDGLDGVARGVADALLCLGGFWLLGGALGLRR